MWVDQSGTLAGDAGSREHEQIAPPTRERIAENRLNEQTSHFGPAYLDALAGVEDVSRAQPGKRANADKNRPGTGEPDANARAGESIGVFPASRQVRGG